MGFCICQRSTFLIRSWESNEQHQLFDTANEVVVQVESMPDFSTQRWDGDKGLRPATPQELVDRDTSQRDEEANGAISDKLMRSVVIYLMGRLNELRTQPSVTYPALSVQDVRDGIIGIYKGLS